MSRQHVSATAKVTQLQANIHSWRGLFVHQIQMYTDVLSISLPHSYRSMFLQSGTCICILMYCSAQHYTLSDTQAHHDQSPLFLAAARCHFNLSSPAALTTPEGEGCVLHGHSRQAR